LVDASRSPTTEPAPTQDKTASRTQLAFLSLGALGVVYGDIGTSPLYTLQACFMGQASFPILATNVIGILSLILWTLTITVTLKYVIFVLRADNQGEGGIMALLAQLNILGPNPNPRVHRRRRWWLIVLGLLGATLLYGDGMITPAISVLSAIQGLDVVTPALNRYIVPATILVLIFLFAIQRRGTGDISNWFGPIMTLWFATLALSGLVEIIHHPFILIALNPLTGLRFLLEHRLGGFLVLGAVILAVTGAEALYADLGHFGRSPIRLAWFALVFPGLILNYLGQGALLLHDPQAISAPLYQLVPHWALIPTVLLATAATVIASQSIISGSFSLMGQSIRLNQTPRLKIIQTSPEKKGRIYIPALNWFLMFGTIGLVLAFQTSNNLAGAYGVAISTLMWITTIFLMMLAHQKWKWHPIKVAAVLGGFLLIDTIFWLSTLTKIAEGGWFPILISLILFTLMMIWSSGRQELITRLQTDIEPWDAFLAHLEASPPVRVPGTAIYFTAPNLGVPPALANQLTHLKCLHENVILLTVITEDIPTVHGEKRLDIENLGHNFFHVFVHFGFMQNQNIPVALAAGALKGGVPFDPLQATYFIGRESLIIPERAPWPRLPRRIFAFLSRNASRATDFYEIPAERAVEFGILVNLTPDR